MRVEKINRRKAVCVCLDFSNYYNSYVLYKQDLVELLVCFNSTYHNTVEISIYSFLFGIQRPPINLRACHGI